jgi:hypothetical protein
MVGPRPPICCARVAMYRLDPIELASMVKQMVG